MAPTVWQKTSKKWFPFINHITDNFALFERVEHGFKDAIIVLIQWTLKKLTRNSVLIIISKKTLNIPLRICHEKRSLSHKIEM